MTALAAVVAAGLAGVESALSAVLGGAISVVAGWASAAVARRRRADSAGGILVGAMKAEVVKLGLIGILLWAVLASWRDVVVPAFLGTFMATALVFSMAFFVSDKD